MTSGRSMIGDMGGTVFMLFILFNMLEILNTVGASSAVTRMSGGGVDAACV